MATSREQEARTRLEKTFSKEAIKVLELSKQEAQSLEHNYVGPEHIFLALTKDNQAREALILMGVVDPDEVAKKVKDILKVIYRPVDKKFGLNARAEEIIKLAINESNNRNPGEKIVTSVDILVGVIKLGEGTPWWVLRNLGVNKDTLSNRQIARRLKILRNQN